MKLRLAALVVGAGLSFSALATAHPGIHEATNSPRLPVAVRSLDVPVDLGFVLPARRIYIAPDDHTDYLWTADEATYRQAFLDMLDYYLDQADATANEPPQYQARFNVDGSFWLWTYERQRTPAQFARLMSRVRDGHIGVPLNPLSTVYGASPTEAILRGMYYPGQLERRFDLRLRSAYSMENQTQPFGVYALWSGSGAKYSWKGICACATEVQDAWDRPADIFWGGGKDGSKLLVKWNSLLVSNQAMGGYAEARDPFGIVDYVDSDLNFRARYPFDRIGAFGKGWDDLQTLTTEFVTAAKQKSNAARQVYVSNEEDFFRDFEASGDATALPTIALSYGNEWELFAAAFSEISARLKRSTENLRAAEAMTSVVTLVNPCFTVGREAARDRAFLDLGLFFEHDLAGDGAVPADVRRDWQKRLVSEIEGYVDPLLADAKSALSGMIQKSGSNRRLFAFNPLSWVRSDLADFPFADPGTFRVLEVGSGQEVPSQIVTVDGQRRLRFLASAVPALGYKSYEIVPGAGTTFSDAATVSSSTIENAFYRVVLSGRGAITSLVDKLRGNREFVRTIDARTMNDLGSGSGTVAVENQGPVSVTLRATSSAGLAHTSRLTFVRDSPRISVQNDITQGFNDTQSWGYGFNVDNPDIRHEELGSILRAKFAPVGDYATAHARWDWLTLNHFFDIGGIGGGMTFSNWDLLFMKVGRSSPDLFDTATPSVSLLAGGRVAVGSSGILNQGGDTQFRQRFALTGRDTYDPAAAMRFALEHQTPLVVGEISGGTTLPATNYSLLSVSNPNVLVWAAKPAEEGVARGLALRSWNLSDATQSTSLAFSGAAIEGGARTTHLETADGPLPAIAGQPSLSFASQQLRTVIARLNVQTPLASPTLTVTKSGSNAVLNWSSTGQSCYLVLRGHEGSLGGATTLATGPATTATDAATLSPGTAAFYVVE